jgi:hypothetical protein
LHKESLVVPTDNDEPAGCERLWLLLGWMSQAAIMAIVIGTLLLSVVLTIGIYNKASELLALPSIVVAVGIVATIAVFLTVALIALPIRFIWKRPLSVMTMAVGSASAGGLIYSAQTVLLIYDSFVIKTGVIIGDGSLRQALHGALLMFAIGAMYGGIFGYVYGRLENNRGRR